MPAIEGTELPSSHSYVPTISKAKSYTEHRSRTDKDRRQKAERSRQENDSVSLECISVICVICGRRCTLESTYTFPSVVHVALTATLRRACTRANWPRATCTQSCARSPLGEKLRSR